MNKNHRNVLHVVIEHPTAGRLHVAVVHLSYDKRQQCENMMEILTFLEGLYFVVMSYFNKLKKMKHVLKCVLFYALIK